jgi:glutamine synthetase
VPDDQRVELRGGDGSANPYLAIAAALGAGLDGIKRSLDPARSVPRASAHCRRRCCTPSTSWRPTR